MRRIITYFCANPNCVNFNHILRTDNFDKKDAYFIENGYCPDCNKKLNVEIEKWKVKL